MSKHLATDSAVWNRLMYGISRRPIEAAAEDWAENSDEKGEIQAHIYDEKHPLEEPPRRGCKNVRLLKIVWLVAVVVFLLNRVGFDYGQLCGMRVSNGPATLKNYGGFVDTGLVDEAAGPKEIFEVSFPFEAKRIHGKPVYSHDLLSHTFDSWGHPHLARFQAPRGVKFNKVVLTLNTSVSGVQYDRLGHLYVGGAEIWRTSTIEPGHNSVFSSVKKDVSQYAHLFQYDTDILFQLDNLVTGRLTGEFHVHLHADFYYSEDSHHGAERSGGSQLTTRDRLLDKKYTYFDIRKPADKIYPLVKEESNSLPPIKYYPHEGLRAPLPKVSHQTTRLKLSVFASGNAQEEFWYGNVLDKYTHRFEKDGTLFHGHGPLRFLNVWVDGKKVASQTPQPFIFTGSFSPALWNAVVPVDAFDLPSVDFDLSALLPLLWESDSHNITISVDNGLDEVDGTESGIGNDWIISANLLAYENDEISSSFGEIVSISEDKRASHFGISLPYTSTLQQFVDGKFGAEIVANLVFKLKNGDILNNTVTAITKGEVSSIQLYTRSGKDAKVVHIGESSKSFLLVDNAEEEIIHQTEITHKYPLTLVESETVLEDGVDVDVTLVNGKQTTLKINERTVMDESNFQNGTSTYHLREEGNYGTGDLETKFKSKVSGPGHKFTYKRRVKASGGVILSDKASFTNGTEHHHKCGGGN